MSTTLRCPGCGGSCLHHDGVDVWVRDGKDDRAGQHVHVSGCDPEVGSAECQIAVDRSMLGNPSSRRGGVRIRFWCETCDARPELYLAQHKGQTIASGPF